MRSWTKVNQQGEFMLQESFQNWPKSLTLIVWMCRLEYWLTKTSITVTSRRPFFRSW